MLTYLPNPIVLQRADPYVILVGDTYYFTGSYPKYDRIVLRKASRLCELQSADEQVIWRKHADGPMSHLIWAPELHRVADSWVIYFAAARTEQIDPVAGTFQHKIFCLENLDPDPFSDNWRERGQIDTGMDTFSLDATSFVLNGIQYLVWAQQDLHIESNSNLYIARMKDPWTLDGRAVMLSKPEFDWERIRFAVEEGPAILLHGGYVFLTYSASGTGPEYAMGMLSASISADLLDPNSWTKSRHPIFRSNPAVRQFGPGHNSFTVAKNGYSNIIVYHCRNYVEVVGDPLFDPNRHARIGIISWGEDGTPDFGTPQEDTRWTPATTKILPPSGTFNVCKEI